MKMIFELEPSTGGFDWEECKHILLVGSITFGLGISLMIIMIPILVYFYYRQLSHVQNKLSGTTLKLFKMLTKTLAFQAVFVIILLIIPFMFLAFLFYTHSLWGSYANLTFFLASFHSFCETFTLLYMVRHYREYVYELYTIFKKKYLKRDINSIFVAQNNLNIPAQLF